MPVSLDGQTYELRVVQIKGGGGGLKYSSNGYETMVSFTALIFPAALTPSVPSITSAGAADTISGTGTSGQTIQVDLGGVTTLSTVASGGVWSVAVPFLPDGAYQVRARYSGGQWSLPSLLLVPGPLKAALRAQLLGSAAGLVLDFAGTQGGLILAPAAPSSQYLGTAIGATVFTRASTATRINAQGLLETVAANVPRMDYDPVTLALRGALIEPASTNMMLQSQNFTSAGGWVLSGVSVTADAVAAPDGTMSAELLTVAPGTNQHLFRTVAVSPETIYTFSVFVRLGTLAATDYRMAFYDGTALSFIAVDIPPVQVPTGSGWTRCSYSVTTPAGCTSLRVYPFRRTLSADATLFLWGAQLEARSTATSYIPTTTTSVSRSADTLTVSGGAWINSLEGTLLVRSQAVVPAASALLMAELDGGSSAAPYLSGAVLAASGESLYVRYGASAAVDLRAYVAANLGASVAWAARYAGSSIAVTRDGRPLTKGTATGPAGPALSRLLLSDGVLYGSAANHHARWLKQVAYWPVALSDAEIQVLTA